MSNNPHFFSQFFIELEALLPRFAILNRELQLLHVQSQHPEDFTSLSQAAIQAMQFFTLKEGDLVLMNEPTCGGLGSGDLTWVTVSNGLVISFRNSHANPWTISTKREDEGLRIPPTPLRMNGELNSSLLDILCEQGASRCRSDEFKKSVMNAIEVLRPLSERIANALRIRPEILDRDKQKSYLTFSRNYFLKKVIDRIHGETRIDLPLRTGESLKLRVLTEDVGIKIDFSGSTPGQKLFIPEFWSQSAVIAFVMDQMNEKEFFNQGCFSAINLIKPQQSFLSTKSQPALGPAQRLAVPTIWTAMHLAFYDLLPKSFPAPHDYFPMQIQWSTDNGVQEFVLPSGSGAFRERESAPSYLLNKNHQTSLGIFNRTSEFEVLDLHERKLSAQRTSTSGGAGWSLKLKTQKPVSIQWYGNNIKFPYRFAKTLTAIEPAEIMINNEVRSEVFGRMDLQVGDEVILNSGQGAGFNS